MHSKIETKECLRIKNLKCYETKENCTPFDAFNYLLIKFYNHPFPDENENERNVCICCTMRHTMQNTAK